MDAYQQGQHHRFMRPPAPPPPSTADPYHHHHQPQFPPQAPQHHWYPNHFHYSPSPPPPPQWGPPQPLPPHHQSYPAPRHSQFPPPPPPPPHGLPPPHNQEWGAHNWGHHQHQGWDYQAQSNEEDWAAKARAWAESNKAIENQHPQSQFAPPGRVDEHSHYHEQYPNSAESHYTEVHHPSLHASNYQQVQAAPLPRPPVNHSLEVPYAPDGPFLAVRDGTSAADSSSMIQRQGILPSSSVHQQEVPSSYSSATGNDGGVLPTSNSAPLEGQHHLQPPPAMPLADQPLEFAPRFNHDNPHKQSSYPYLDPVGPAREMDIVATGPSMNNWAAPAHYPPIPPVLPPGPQHDPAVVVPPVPPYSNFPGSSLQPPIPSAGTPFAVSAVTALHQNTVFSGDAYGVPSLSERPKKATVPNWLKEEIKKAVITTPSLDHPKEESHSVSDEVDDRSVGRGDQEDSKSIDSSRSAEDDEEDEDYEDAARTAAINQEIKRVLTEVLLKVTDELFDEIATKVLDENNPTGEVDKSMVTSNHTTSLSTSMLPNPKADAKLIPGKFKEPESEGISEKSSSISPGDVLGLADYATDEDDEDNEIQTLNSTNFRRKDVPGQSTSRDKHDVDVDVDANGSSLVQPAGINRNKLTLERDPSKANSTESNYSSADKSTPDDAIPSRSKDVVSTVRSEPPEDVDSIMKTSKNNAQVKETKSDKNNRQESKKSSRKDVQKDEEDEKVWKDKDNGNHQRNDERHSRKEKDKHLDRAHETESKKRSSHVDDKEEKKERESNHKGGSKEEVSRRKEHAKDKDDDKSRHKRLSDPSRNNKRRSSSISRGRSSKDNSAHRDTDDTSDDASNNSKRKSRSRRRNLSPSPSPVKSRRRKVSRSPHSEHSQRRHSPYSSHETNRGRRSRSRSPVRRRR